MLREDYDQGTLRKEQIFVLLVEQLKTAALRKFY